MRLSLRRVRARWKLKLASLGLAILLWVVVSAEQTTTQWIPVRIEPVVRDPDYVLSSAPDPATVRVRFRGPGRELWELALERPTLVLRLNDVGNARSFSIDPQMVVIPEGVRNVQAMDVRPAVVRVDLERLATRRVPVRPRVGARSLAHYVLGDTPTVVPAEVRLTGPEEALARIDAVPTRPFEIVPEDSSFSQRVNLDTTGLSGITLSSQEVRVSGRVRRRGDRTFAAVPVTAPEGVHPQPLQVDVVVSGPEDVVRRIAPAQLHAIVRRDSLPTRVPDGGLDARVVIEGLPDGVSARALPERVRVLSAAAATDSDQGAVSPPARPAGSPASPSRPPVSTTPPLRPPVSTAPPPRPPAAPPGAARSLAAPAPASRPVAQRGAPSSASSTGAQPASASPARRR